jgi:cyclase
VCFKDPAYIGDPVNTVRIFNELEVDELTFLDITASKEGRGPNLRILEEIADECFMPLSYGGGIDSLSTAEKIFQIGFEKVVINTASFQNPQLISDLAKHFGSQSVIVAIDVKKGAWWSKYDVTSRSGTVNQKRPPVEWAREVESLGAGEILLTSIDREGTWKGFDVELTEQVARIVSIPVIANGGAGRLEHIRDVVKTGRASAVALGSMVVFQRRGLGVLVNFPDKNELRQMLA